MQNFIKLNTEVHELSCPPTVFALSRNGEKSENPVTLTLIFNRVL